MKKIVWMLGLSCLAGPALAGTTYYSRGDAGNGCTDGDLKTAVKWYTDVNCADAALAAPQPVPTADDGNTYVFLTSKKFNAGATFPAGTHVWFGLPDGSKTFAPNCSSGTWSVPDGTVYGWTFKPNWNYTGVIKGNYTFVKTAREIAFGAQSLTDSQAAGKNPYGETLGDAASTFSGAADVLVNLYCEYGSGEGNGMCRVVVAGDFSGFKGRIATVAVKDRTGANLGFLDLRYTSATAFGDPGTPSADALTLRHRAQLSLTDGVAQHASRGITVDLASGKYAAFRAEAGASWTLTAPVAGAPGIAGTLRKTGAGTVTYDGDVKVPFLEATEGTLVLGEHASFDAGTALTVRSGAKLVVRRATGVADLALTVEPGGLVVYEVPYDPETRTATPVDVCAAEADQLGYPLGVQLTQNLALPFNEPARLCVLRFAADCARTLAPGDFVLQNAKSYRLPTTWFSVERDAEGRTQVFLDVKAAISQTGQRLGQASRTVSGATEYTWSDHEKEHAGADYFSLRAYGSYAGGRTKDGSNIAGTFAFAGDSYTLGGNATADQSLYDYCERLLFSDLRLYRRGTLFFTRASTGGGVFSGGVRDRTLSGSGFVDGDAMLGGTEAKIIINSSYPDGQDLNVVDMAFSGTGTLQIYSTVSLPAETPNLVRVYGVNTNFAGRLFLYADGLSHFMQYSATNGFNFGGAPATPMADGVRIAPLSSVTDPKVVAVQADESLVVDEPNRGWTVTCGTLRAPEGVTFTLKSPLTVVTRLVKDGPGTLALGCATTGEGKPFTVEAGYLMPLTATCCAPLAVTFADGAGVELDAAVEGDVRRTGLVAQSIALEGTLKATIRDWDACGEAVVRRAILTVPSTTASLADRIELVGNHATKRLVSATDAAAGTTTYFAEFSVGGTTILFR